MPTPRDEGLKKTTIRFPEALHRWYRHRAVDDNTHFEAAVIAALTDWAAARGFDTSGLRTKSQTASQRDT